MVPVLCGIGKSSRKWILGGGLVTLGHSFLLKLMKLEACLSSAALAKNLLNAVISSELRSGSNNCLQLQLW